MHIYFYLRGIRQYVDLAKSFLESQYWKLRITNLETKQEEQIIFQGGLRDSVLGVVEYIFPKESLPEFLSMIKHTSPEKIGVSSKKGLHKFKLATLRKMLGCKKIPKKIYKQAQEIENKVMIDGYERCLTEMPQKNVSIHMIGIKEDKFGSTNGKHYHELL